MWRTLGEHNLLKYMYFQGCWPVRAGRLRLSVHAWPPTSNDHNFFIRTLFWVFLDSMEIPLSQYFIHILWRTVGGNNLLKYMFFQGYWLVRPGWLGLTGHAWPLISDGHNVFVRTPFQVLLKSIESQLSQYSRNITMENNG